MWVASAHQDDAPVRDEDLGARLDIVSQLLVAAEQKMRRRLMRMMMMGKARGN